MARGRKAKAGPEDALKDAAEETAPAAPAAAKDGKRKASSDADDEAKRAKTSDAALIAEALAGDAQVSFFRGFATTSHVPVLVYTQVLCMYVVGRLTRVFLFTF
jgi:hypothetical protein